MIYLCKEHGKKANANNNMDSIDSATYLAICHSRSPKHLAFDFCVTFNTCLLQALRVLVA